MTPGNTQSSVQPHITTILVSLDYLYPNLSPKKVKYNSGNKTIGTGLTAVDDIR